METQFVVERDCSALGGLFQIIINDMKSGTGNWDDFVQKANKFHNQLKATIAASTAFLDAFQKIADMATSTRGGTKEIGTALTRLCLRHRSVEARLKTFTSSIMDCLVLPLQDRVEEWKKTCGQLDKEHSKEYKRLRQELKKKQFMDSSTAIYGSTSNTLRLKKQIRNRLKVDSNNWNSLHAMSRSMDSMEANEKLFIFEEMEKKAVRRALVEERSHFCLFVNFLRPVVEEELAMLQEVTHLQEILDSLCKLTADPYSLPTSSELVISDLRLSSSETAAFSLQTPPSSPSSFGSRKSSMCSISSFNSSSSGSTHSPSHHCRYRSLSQPSVGPTGPVFRHTSISSQESRDSGFMSQDYNVIHYAQLPICSSSKYVKHYNNNNEVSNLSEQSSGSTSSASSIPPSNQRMDTTLSAVRSHTINTYDTNRSHGITSGETVIHIGDSDVQKKQSNHNYDKKKPPAVPSRGMSSVTPSLPSKPNAMGFGTNQCQTSNASLYCESHPIYANSSELMSEDLNVAYSEGSITPTNPERSNSPYSELLSQTKNSSLSVSTLSISRSSKPPPPPPMRRTSTISNPNAITLGTLKSVGVNTYEEIQNLAKSCSTYEEINSLTHSLQNLSSNESPKYCRPSDAVIYLNTSQMMTTHTNGNNRNNDITREYKSAKSVFEHSDNRDVQHRGFEDEASAPSLPAPPPEAFSDCDSNHSHHYNKITNVHRQFLESLNSKLGQFKPESHISPRLAKRRSLSHNREEEWNSDGAHRPTSHTQTIQQTLMAFMTGNHSRSSSASSTSSKHRRQSPEARDRKKSSSFTLASCDRQSLMASLNSRLSQKQQTEMARAAASAANAMHRKQTFPDIHTTQAQYYSTSALNLANVPQAATQYQSIGQQPIAQGCQQIYAPVVHQQHLQRRSSQPNMGIKIINTTARQPTYEAISGQSMAAKANGGQNYQQKPQSVQQPQQQQPNPQTYSSDFYANVRHNANSMPSESNNKSIYSSNSIQTSIPTTNRMSSNPDNFETAVAARVNCWFNSVQLPHEVKVCRESLMDQIRRGKPLRKISATNDRSAPKV